MSQSIHRFVAAGRAAQHCEALFPRQPDPAELSRRWLELGAELAKALAPKLAAMLDGKVPEIAPSSEPAALAGLAASALIVREGTDGALQLGIEGAAVLQLVDRAFGGSGDVPSPLPTDFAPSARLLIERLEAMVLEALAEVLTIPATALIVRLRSASMAALPLRGGASAGLTLTVTEPGRPVWTIGLALPQAALAGWLKAAPGRTVASQHHANPARPPFDELPLRLHATLVDMAIPLSTIATLAPGTVLPVAVARSVPLSAGRNIIARGTVGLQDDCVALKLTQIA